MNVKELRQKLSQFPDDADIWVDIELEDGLMAEAAAPIVGVAGVIIQHPNWNDGKKFIVLKCSAA